MKNIILILGSFSTLAIAGDIFVVDSPPFTGTIKQIEKKMNGKIKIIETYNADSEESAQRIESSSSCSYSGYCHGYGYSMGKYQSGYAYRTNCQGKKITTKIKIPTYKVIHMELKGNDGSIKKLVARSNNPTSYDNKEEISACK